jgi:NADPH2:quinone reductase
MRRILCTAFGDPDGLALVEAPVPAPVAGEVLVETEAIGVSFVDGLVVRGDYQIRPPLPFTPGNCFVGRVASVGPGVDPASVGRRVAGVTDGLGGAYSSHVVVSADGVAEVPVEIGSHLAAAIIENYLTLTFATRHRVTITPGESVVVLGAGGGIGLAAVDVARAQGARVIAVASTAEKRDLALRTGAGIALGYEDLKNRIREVTSGAGADVVFDPVGGNVAESALRALATGGRFCVVGFASGEIPRLPANIVLLRNRSVVGVDWGDWSREVGGAAGNARLLTEVFARVAAGELHPPLPTVVASLSEAGRVLELIGSRRAVGRLVLVP